MTEQLVPTADCACRACNSACTHKPGWFAPGEAERLASARGVPLKELFDTELVLDYYANKDDEELPFTWVLSPAWSGSIAGEEAPFDPTGTCRWFVDGGCAVHVLGKPLECRVVDHDTPDHDDHHKQVADLWRAPEHQALARELLGREPVVAEPDPEAAMRWLLENLLGSQV